MVLTDRGKSAVQSGMQTFLPDGGKREKYGTSVHPETARIIRETENASAYVELLVMREIDR